MSSGHQLAHVNFTTRNLNFISPTAASYVLGAELSVSAKSYAAVIAWCNRYNFAACSCPEQI